MRLLFDLGLRRGEVVSLDLEHLDFEAGTVAVLGKGRSQRELLTLPAPTREALAAWVAIRGLDTGPLFIGLDRAHRRGGLTGAGVYLVVRSLGEKAGIRARPHGLRHAAITRALDITAGDVRAVQRFSRHRNLQTLVRYDDCRRDLGGDVARRLAEEE